MGSTLSNHTCHLGWYCSSLSIPSINGLAQDCTSSVQAVEIPQSCTNSSILCMLFWRQTRKQTKECNCLNCCPKHSLHMCVMKYERLVYVVRYCVKVVDKIFEWCWLIITLNWPNSQIPQCICPISHNAPFCNRNVQNGALWDICQILCEMGLFYWYGPIFHEQFFNGNRIILFRVGLDNYAHILAIYLPFQYIVQLGAQSSLRGMPCLCELVCIVIPTQSM